MDLKIVSDKKLVEQTDELASNEPEILIDLLKHLLEIDRRRLFSALGYESLNAFLMERYKYNKDQTLRRISAMKLLAELPEIEAKIEKGLISLTHISVAQSLFRHEQLNHGIQMSSAQKLEVIERIENLPTREAQRVIFSMASSPIVHTIDLIRDIGSERIEIKFSARMDLEEKIKTLKGLLAHSHPHMSTADLVEMLCELGMEKWHPARRFPRRSKTL